LSADGRFVTKESIRTPVAPRVIETVNFVPRGTALATIKETYIEFRGPVTPELAALNTPTGTFEIVCVEGIPHRNCCVPLDTLIGMT
jgi:hypothetical protein